MAEDWSLDVRKYVPNADSNVIAGIVQYCGIALQNRDSSLVSFKDETEVARVREHYLKKKLGLTSSDAELDQAIAAVGVRMKPDHTRNRVTVYYLLAEHFRKLSVFGGTDAVAGVGAAAAAAATVAAAESVVRPTVVQPPQAAFVGVAAAPQANVMRWLPWLILASVLALLLWWFLSQRAAAPVAAVEPSAPAVVTAPVVTAPIAAEARVVDLLPARVHFAVGSSVLSADDRKTIAAVADEVGKDGNLKVAVTGYTDRTGDLPSNQVLANHRAKAVHDALAAAGVSGANIEMRPPSEVETGAPTGGDPEGRRVDITRG